MAQQRTPKTDNKKPATKKVVSKAKPATKPAKSANTAYVEARVGFDQTASKSAKKVAKKVGKKVPINKKPLMKKPVKRAPKKKPAAPKLFVPEVTPVTTPAATPTESTATQAPAELPTPVPVAISAPNLENRISQVFIDITAWRNQETPSLTEQHRIVEELLTINNALPSDVCPGRILMVDGRPRMINSLGVDGVMTTSVYLGPHRATPEGSVMSGDGYIPNSAIPALLEQSRSLTEDGFFERNAA